MAPHSPMTLSMVSFGGINVPRNLVTVTLSFAGGCCGISYLLGCSVPQEAVNKPHSLSKKVACGDITEDQKMEKKTLSTMNICDHVQPSPAERGL